MPGSEWEALFGFKHLSQVMFTRFCNNKYLTLTDYGAICSSMVKAFGHCAMGRQIDLS